MAPSKGMKVTISLDLETGALVEALRAKRGLRSLAAVVAELVRAAHKENA